jgi:hypothetical protein
MASVYKYVGGKVGQNVSLALLVVIKSYFQHDALLLSKECFLTRFMLFIVYLWKWTLFGVPDLYEKWWRHLLGNAFSCGCYTLSVCLDIYEQVWFISFHIWRMVYVEK